MSIAAAANSSLNPFKPYRTVAKVFNVLADGGWHSVPLLETRFKRALGKRLKAIANKGRHTRRWVLEQEADQVRLTFKEVPPDAPGSPGTPEGEELSETRQTQLRFWTAYRAYMQQNSSVRCGKANPRSSLTHRLGTSGIAIFSEVSTWDSDTGLHDPEIRVDLGLWGKWGKKRFAVLHTKRQEIERALGMPVTWYSTETTNSCYVYIRLAADYFNEQLWPQQHQWLKDNVEVFHRVFMPYVEEFREYDDEQHPSTNNE